MQKVVGVLVGLGSMQEAYTIYICNTIRAVFAFKGLLLNTSNLVSISVSFTRN